MSRSRDKQSRMSENLNVAVSNGALTAGGEPNHSRLRFTTSADRHSVRYSVQYSCSGVKSHDATAQQRRMLR